MIVEWHSADEASTQEYAKRLAHYCTPPLVIHFQGQLGAGKSTFIRAMLRSMGVTDTIKSPTYALLEPYQINQLHVYHFDLYRLSDAEELEYIGIRDYLQQDALCLIEWPEKGKGFIPEADLLCKIDILANARTITMNSNNQKGLAILQQLA